MTRQNRCERFETNIGSSKFRNKMCITKCVRIFRVVFYLIINSYSYKKIQMKKKCKTKKNPSLTEKSETCYTVSFHEIRAPLDEQGSVS
jgi:hypothetical protein